MTARNRGIERARAEILEAAIVRSIASRPSGCMTFGIVDLLRRDRGFIVDTAEIYRRCRSLEARGVVERVPSAYRLMRCWRVAS